MSDVLTEAVEEEDEVDDDEDADYGQSLDSEKYAEAAEKLDKYLPDWWKKIELETLDLKSNDHCVLAQATGRSYVHAISNLLEAGWDDIDEYHEFQYYANGDEWARIIRQRRGEVANV